jgi:GTPase
VDVLLHVLDVASDGAEDRYSAVEEILEDLELAGLPRVLALNKADSADPFDLDTALERWNAVAISAVQREGMDELRQRLLETMVFARNRVEVVNDAMDYASANL